MKYKRNVALVLLLALFLALPLYSYAQFGLGKIGGFFQGVAGGIAGFGKAIPGAVGDIAGAIANRVGNTLISLLWQTPLAISSTLWLVAAALLKFVLSPEFLGLPITSPDFKEVYQMWQMVRDFTNMGFVLALVIIGIGTALRYGEYQLQRALPRLILIALLINFTPVIVGFFIDAANITIRFLVSGAAGDNLAQVARRAFDGNAKLWLSIGNGDNAVDTLAAATAQIIFNIVASLVYFLFVLLYIFRYVTLIILFILSPLAFFSFILPATRGFWTMWWRQFVAWLTVGIFGAFFILLSAQMVGIMWTVPPPDVGSGVLGVFTEFINVFVTAMVPIAMLIVGFFFTMQTSAMGANAIIQFGHRAEGWTLNKGKAWAKGKYESVTEGVGSSEKIRQAVNRVATLSTDFGRFGKWGREEKSFGGFAKRRISDITLSGPRMLGGGIRTAGRKAHEQLEAGEIRRTQRAAEEYKKLVTPSELLSTIRGAGTRAQKVGALQAAAEKKWLPTLEGMGLTEDEQLGPIEEAVATNPATVKNLMYTGTELAQKVYDRAKTRFSEKQRAAAGLLIPLEEHSKWGGEVTYDAAGNVTSVTEGSYMRKIMATATAKQIEGWSINSLRDQSTNDLREQIKIALREFGTGEQLSAIGRTFGRDLVQQIGRYLKNDVGEAWLEKHNKPLLNYLKSTAAQGLGYEEIRGNPTTSPPPPHAPYVAPAGPSTKAGGGPSSPPPGGGAAPDTGLGSKKKKT